MACQAREPMAGCFSMGRQPETEETEMTYRIFIQDYAGRESHYGDCATWAEVQKEIRCHIRSLGLGYRVAKVPS
jgi:hypothetical protein